MNKREKDSRKKYQIKEYLLIAIFIVTALLAAVVGLKAYSVYREETAEERRKYEEILARNAEAQNRIQEMEIEIAEMITDKDALQNFIDETVRAAEEVQRQKEASVSGNVSVSGDENVSGNTVSGNMSVSGNTILGNMSVSGNTISGNESVSGNRGMYGAINYYDGSMTESSIFDEWRTIYEQPVMTLEERRLYRTSLEETLEVNQADREWIAESKYDFSQMKIACLGDSITAAANLEGEENYIQYSYPARLQELLGAQEVYNLGIGGSSIGRYWSDAFVDRYKEIPKDTDIIIVMGGTNDGFCVSDEEFGNLDERAYRTFCGDLNELMSGLRKEYPDAVIFFATPLPNILQDYLMSERDYLLPQKKFVEVIQILAEEYDFQLVDLYNSNILDSHDANIIAEYMSDGVHGNPAGYQILAEHFASEIVKYYDEIEVGEEIEEDEGRVSTLQ
ncbi:MAG: SGNH/GDSL hydrolase family protein [Lachnospiraceae bacterium]|nr:SGNH/GDSL hydrolase family protein [Lachnospiraceae bacterium]